MTDNGRRWCVKCGRYENPRQDAMRDDWPLPIVVLFPVHGRLHCQDCTLKPTETAKDKQRSSGERNHS